ncbi:MAG: homoserine kinase [Sphingomonadaceae bacterium]
MPTRVTVRVPATSANLGPGFDSIGIALDIYNTVAIEASDEFGVSLSGEGVDVLSQGQDNLVYQGVLAVYEKLNKPVPPLRLSCENWVPLARGLGSSSAALVAGLVAGNEFLGHPLSAEALLQIATKMEGHPDNVTPALFGGLQVAVMNCGTVQHLRVPLAADLGIVVFVPDFPMLTSEAREVLPRHVSRADAIFNISRAALLIAAMATGSIGHLKAATEDALHQPYRLKLFPAMEEIIGSALGAGASGAALSGAGSSILAFSLGGEERVAEAMGKAGERAGVDGRTIITKVCYSGAQVIERG